MKQTLTTKYFQDIYPGLTDADKIAYVDAMYSVCEDKEFQGTLPTSLKSGSNLKVFHLRKKGGEFNTKQYLQDMLSSPRGYIRIIGLYLLATRVKFHTSAIAYSIVHRHSRDAKLLEPWLETDAAKESLKRAVLKTAQHARDNNYQFTLQTVYKQLTSEQ